MPIDSQIQNAANHTIVKNRCEAVKATSKKFEVVSSRKQQSAIRTDSKMYRKIIIEKEKEKKSILAFSTTFA